MQTDRTDLWTQQGKEKVGWIERVVLTYIHCHVLNRWLVGRCWASLVAQLVKNPPTTWETWVWSLGWEDLLEKKMVPIPVFWPGEFHELYGPWGGKELDTTERLSFACLGSCYLTQGSQPGALWPPRGLGWEEEGGSRGRGTYIIMHFLKGRNQQHYKTVILQLKKKRG